MIKNYLNLTANEKLLVVEFIKEKTNSKEEEVISRLESEVYKFGEGVFVYIKNGFINGCLSIVLELVEKNNTVYIHNIIVDDKEILKELINFSITYVENEYLVNEIYLASKDNTTLDFLEELGYSKDYSSYKMKLVDYKGINEENILEVEALTEDKIDEYVKLYEDTFLDMPHGTFITKEEVMELLSKPKNEYEIFFVKKDNEYIGFIEAKVEENIGEFDIGLVKEHRSKGYGSHLVDKAINILKNKKVKDINLIVIERNSVAFNLYKKLGFEIEDKLSDWIIIKPR